MTHRKKYIIDGGAFSLFRIGLLMSIFFKVMNVFLIKVVTDELHSIYTYITVTRIENAIALTLMQNFT